jgi:hypothetical protein
MQLTDDERHAIRVVKDHADGAELPTLLGMLGLLPEDEPPPKTERSAIPLYQQHGTKQCYDRGKCRCELCSEADYNWRQAKWAESREAAAIDPSVIPHGTEVGYVRWRCRCEDCKAERKRVNAIRTARLLERAAADPSIVPHGTSSGYYHWKCHCELCREYPRQVKRNQAERKKQNARG